jgi:hypothetical protein
MNRNGLPRGACLPAREHGRLRRYTKPMNMAPTGCAFVARWCVGAKAETAGGVFQARDDDAEARVSAGTRKTR